MNLRILLFVILLTVTCLFFIKYDPFSYSSCSDDERPRIRKRPVQDEYEEDQSYYEEQDEDEKSRMRKRMIRENRQRRAPEEYKDDRNTRSGNNNRQESSRNRRRDEPVLDRGKVYRIIEVRDRQFERPSYVSYNKDSTKPYDSSTEYKVYNAENAKEDMALNNLFSKL
jgi:hypothetical protein